MTDEIRIHVTPNLKECLNIFRTAAAALPEGDLKNQAAAAVEYVAAAFRGEPQPEGGRSCPGGKFLIQP